MPSRQEATREFTKSRAEKLKEKRMRKKERERVEKKREAKLGAPSAATKAVNKDQAEQATSGSGHEKQTATTRAQTKQPSTFPTSKETGGKLEEAGSL